ncbi:MAG: hypothetical protein M1829_000125 [Trizodia sp. TS-e1964]|nr:MAG: hypothetical protein M1829_000125 [Trizodia sp. TS-e1964]
MAEIMRAVGPYPRSPQPLDHPLSDHAFSTLDIKGGRGPASSLFINPSVPKPAAGPAEALVKIKAFGLNRMDLLQRDGYYPIPKGASQILGVEFSGIIEGLGEEVAGRKGGDDTEGFRVGDEVFGLAYGGAYAEYIAVSTHMLIPKPSWLSWEEAAGIPETWITATQALFFIGEFHPGASVLFHAGASAVSLSGIQLAKHSGAGAIYVTTSSESKIAFCRSLGATQGFNYHDGDWASKVLDATQGRGVDLIVDFVGANYFQQNLNAAALDGRVVLLGMLSGAAVKEVDISPLLRRRIRVEGSGLRSRSIGYQRRVRDKLVELAMEGWHDKSLKVVIEKVVPWTEIAAAHLFLEGNTSMGKVICTVG